MMSLFPEMATTSEELESLRARVAQLEARVASLELGQAGGRRVLPSDAVADATPPAEDVVLGSPDVLTQLLSSPCQLSCGTLGAGPYRV